MGKYEDQEFEYFIIVHFLVTSLKDMVILPQEIIKISCQIFKAKRSEKIAEFIRFVKPTKKPNLSPYCVINTGVEQKDVEKASPFEEAFSLFIQFLNDYAGKRCGLVVLNDLTIVSYLDSQCQLSKLEMPDFFSTYISLEDEFTRLTNMRFSREIEDKLQVMTEHFKMNSDGHEDKVEILENIMKELERIGTLKALNLCKSEEEIENMEMPELEMKSLASSVISLKDKVKQPQNFDILVILDFEATCLKDMKITPQEIIEFACVAYDLQDLKIIDQFQKYVMPVHRPKLSPFCIRLTGISQEQVDQSKTFPQVYEDFLKWMEQFKERRLLFATCGDWDLKHMLPQQLSLSGIKNHPGYLTQWANLKMEFQRATNVIIERDAAKHDLMQMMETFDLEKTGRWHSGIDDCNNLALIVKCLAHLITIERTNL